VSFTKASKAMGNAPLGYFSETFQGPLVAKVENKRYQYFNTPLGIGW